MHGRGLHPRLFWTGLIVAVVLLVGGGFVAIRGYLATAGPDGAVRGYFAALQDGDAAAALGYGDVPSGSRTLLTDAALADQNRNAAIKQVQIRKVTRTGAKAEVLVRYTLDYPGSPQPIDTDVAVHEDGDDWRLDHVAVATALSLPKASDRATVVGTRITDATVLVFPGAVPVRLDTKYLTLSPTASSVDFAAAPTTDVSVDVSDEGKAEARALVAAGLLACVSGHGPRTCPTPDERYVPGSLRGALSSAAPKLTVEVGSSAAGSLDVSGDVAVSATYRRLTFDNQVRSGRGKITLAVRARSYAVSPLKFVWVRPGDDT